MSEYEHIKLKKSFPFVCSLSVFMLAYTKHTKSPGPKQAAGFFYS